MSDSNRSYVAPASTIILTTIVLVFFFIVFCSVYFCRCVHYWLNLQRARGIQDSAMKKFPTFTYATVKNLGEEKFSLECAICLSDFADDDFLRLLTTCRHVFHKRCIDLWLGSNNTCPVCRTSLDNPVKFPVNSTTQTSVVVNGMDRNEEVGDSVRINIIEGEIEHDENRAHSEGWEAPTHTTTPPTTTNNWVNKLSKSHSTGHWNSRRRISGEERWRLPEHLHTQLISQHSCMRKCSTSRDIERPRWGSRACFGSAHTTRIKMSL